MPGSTCLPATSFLTPDTRRIAPVARYSNCVRKNISGLLGSGAPPALTFQPDCLSRVGGPLPSKSGVGLLTEQGPCQHKCKLLTSPFAQPAHACGRQAEFSYALASIV